MVLFKRHNNTEQVSSNISLQEFETKTPYNDDEAVILNDQESGSVDDEKFDSQTGSKRALKNRHLSLIALAGIIGPGILVGAVSLNSYSCLREYTNSLRVLHL